VDGVDAIVFIYSFHQKVCARNSSYIWNGISQNCACMLIAIAEFAYHYRDFRWQCSNESLPFLS